MNESFRKFGSVKMTIVNALPLAIYCLYVIIANAGAVEKNDQSIILNAGLGTLVLAIATLIVVSYIIIGIAKSRMTFLDVGLSLSTGFWITSVLIIIVTITLARHKQAYATDEAAILIPLVLFAAVNNMVIRAGLCRGLLKLMGDQKLSYLGVGFIVGLVYWLIQGSVVGLSFHTLIFSIALTWLFLMSKSIVINIFADVMLMSSVQYGLMAAILSMIVYIILALLARSATRFQARYA